MKKTELVIGSLLLASMIFTGCSSDDAKGPSSHTEASEADKAATDKAAEAEAAEEAMAKENSTSKKSHKGAAKEHAAKRAVASVKKSDKQTEAGYKESIYIVQVGTFAVEDNAKKMLEKLKTAGLPAFQKKIERENGNVLYAIRLEPTPNHGEAEKFQSSVKSATGENAIILSVGN